MIASKERRRISPRSRGAVAAHPAWAATAASSAAIASVVSPSATSVITDSSAGSWTSNLLPEPDSRHCPPMKRPREPVFAKRSSPVMDSACHWVKFAESVHVFVRTLTLLSHRPGGMHPDDTEPLADPMPRGARPRCGPHVSVAQRRSCGVCERNAGDRPHADAPGHLHTHGLTSYDGDHRELRPD